MTNEELYQSVSKYTAGVFENNKELIGKQIVSGMTNQDDFPTLYSMMVANAIRISMQLSVQTTVSILQQMELFAPADIQEVHKPPNLVLLNND